MSNTRDRPLTEQVPGRRYHSKQNITIGISPPDQILIGCAPTVQIAGRSYPLKAKYQVGDIPPGQISGRGNPSGSNTRSALSFRWETPGCGRPFRLITRAGPPIQVKYQGGVTI